MNWFSELLATRIALVGLSLGLFVWPPAEAAADQQVIPDAVRQLAQEDPEDPASETQKLLDALAQAEDVGTAQNIEHALLQAWTRSGSDTVDLLMSRAAESMERREFPVALELLTTVVEIKPDYAEGWNRRATLYYLMDEYALSVSDIRQTLSIEPRHFGALSGLGLILQSTGRKKSALVAFEEALKVHPFLESASTAAEELEPEVNGIPM
ncbi:MAG: hypothetical protein AAGD23_04035 [Pseudomonadota bacterium]